MVVHVLIRERSRSDCVGEVAWKGKVPGSPFTLKFPLGNRPYSYECLDFDSNWP